MGNNSEIISFNNVSFSYDGVANAIKDVSFKMWEKDVIGIIGPNGGGKTTLLKLILGILEPRQGEIKLFGVSPSQGRRFVGYVPQSVPFERSFPARVLSVVLMGTITGNSFFTSYSKKDVDRALEALKTVEMQDLRDKTIGELSEGQKQRVFIARALVSDPRLLILDEPTSSVDAVIQKTVYELFDRLKQTMSIIIVTHDVGVVSKYVEKIACLNVELFYHNTKEITAADLSKVYKCPVELIAHGVPHRVLEDHHNK